MDSQKRTEESLTKSFDTAIMIGTSKEVQKLGQELNIKLETLSLRLLEIENMLTFILQERIGVNPSEFSAIKKGKK